MNRYLLVCLTVLFTAVYADAQAQCDTIALSKSGWSFMYSNHYDAANSPASNCFDGNNSTYWRSKDAVGNEYPHELVINLGTSPAVNGIGYTPRQANTWNGKLGNYEVYTTWDTTDWGTPEKAGTFTYGGSNDNATQYAYFGAVAAPYIKLVALNSPGSARYVDIAELDVFYNSCGSSGLLNQVISLVKIDKQLTTNNPITLNGTSTSGLPVNYSISGPASISGNQLVLDGTPGTVTLKAFADGNSTYYPADTVYRIFQVIELNDYYPTLNTKLAGGNIYMPTLMAYPIFAWATIDETDYLRIDDIQFEITGETIDTVFRYAPQSYGAYWTPSAYGNYNVKITAVGNNGNTTDTTIAVTVTQTVSDMTVVAINADTSRPGRQTVVSFANLPQQVGAFDSVHAYLDITCPNGGCDPYDRLAWIEIVDPYGNRLQLIRYITPFGIGCSHDVDLTPYMYLLQGNTQLSFYTSTYSGGWVGTLTLDYHAATPTYPYSWLTEIWDASYPFGNMANLQPVDTPTYTFYPNTQQLTMLISNTGHGWGDNNTGNAAEFYHAYHTLKFGDSTFAQNLWYNCNPNPDGCNNQLGTWQYNRSGWCPGALSPNESYNISGMLADHDSISLEYIFQESYIDYCSPQNPSCVSGTTCPNCNDGFYPIYYVDGQMYSQSSTPFIPKQAELPDVMTVGVRDIAQKHVNEYTLYPNPTSAGFKLEAQFTDHKPIVVLIQDISGKMFGNYYFHNSEDLNHQLFRTDYMAKGMYFITIQSGDNIATRKLIVE